MRNRSLWIAVSLLTLVLAVIVVTTLLKETDAPFPTAPESARGKARYTLTLGHDHTTTSPHHLAAMKFAELVNARTNGRVSIVIYPNEQHGTGHEMVEEAREGTLDIALVPAARLTGIAPAMQYIDLPFLFPRREDAYELLDGEIGKKLLSRLEPLGLVGCAFWDSGFKQFTATRPIRRPADFRNLKVRVMRSRIIREQFESFGAQTIPIDFQQLYQALKDRVVDAEENPLMAIAEMKLYEVQPYLTLSNHSYLAYVFLVNKKLMDGLPEDIREIIVSTARETAHYERDLLRGREQGYLETIRKAGVQVITLSDRERAEFEKATGHLRKEYTDQVGREIMDRTDELLTIKYGPGADLVIGLNADLSLGAAVYGRAIRRGMELAVEEINASGGLLGRKVRIVSFDHAGVSARGVANMKKLAAIPHLIAVVGGLHSPVALAELGVVHRNRIVYLGPYANATRLVKNGYKPNYVFRASPPVSCTGEFLAERALAVSGRVALLMENTEWGRDNHDVIVRTLARHNKTPVAEEWMNFDEKNIDRQLAGILNSKAGVLVLAVNPGATLTAVNALAARDTKLPVVSEIGAAGLVFGPELRRDLERVDLRIVQSFLFPGAAGRKAQLLAGRYRKEYHVDRSGQISAQMAVAQAYDLVHLLAMAVRKAGTMERSAIRDSLEQLGSYQGAVRTYDPPFTRQRHEALTKDDLFMARFDGQGVLVPISPR